MINALSSEYEYFIFFLLCIHKWSMNLSFLKIWGCSNRQNWSFWAAVKELQGWQIGDLDNHHRFSHRFIIFLKYSDFLMNWQFENDMKVFINLNLFWTVWPQICPKFVWIWQWVESFADQVICFSFFPI